MTYPRNPPGLRWDEHYTMANMVYYAFMPLAFYHPATQAEPDPLPEDEHDAPPKRKHRGREERTFKSVYVGVTTHNHRYVAPRTCSERHPLTPEGARLAAIDRAIALERDYLERRDGNHEPL